MMCLGYGNDNHFMIIYLKDCCQIPPTSLLWKQHCREDAKSWDERCVQRMIAYNELCRAVGYEAIGDDDLYFVENLDMKRILMLTRILEMESRLKRMKALNLMIVA